MPGLKNFGVLVGLVLALSAITVATASAAFTYSSTGELSGYGRVIPRFTFNGGVVKCSTAKISGAVESLNFAEQHSTVNYSGCNAFGLVGVHISPATFTLTANGEAHLESPIVITVTKSLFTAHCSVTISSQTAGSVAYSNNGSKLIETSTLSGLSYTSTGGVCGSSGENGTYTGASELEMVGGGSMGFDKTEKSGTFTYSKVGEFTGQTLAGVGSSFTFAGGTVDCSFSESSGTIPATVSAELPLTVEHGGCRWSSSSATVSPAEYVLTANGDVHIENTITIKVPSKGCELTIGPQTAETATYSNSGSTLVETSNLSGISYTSSGGSCGSSGEGGGYAGAETIERVGGGSVAFDPARFTYSSTGGLFGYGNGSTAPRFTFNAGTVDCNTVETSGEVVSLSFEEQHVAVEYSGCSAFGLTNVHISPATFVTTGSGEVHIEEPITITVTKTLLTAHCTVTISPQTVGSVAYAGNGSNLFEASSLSGVAYTATGGPCGSSGENGTYVGTSKLEMEGGGSMGFDKTEKSGTFTYSKIGAFSGQTVATSTTTFTFAGGTASCSFSAAGGTIPATVSAELPLTFEYSNCTGFGAGATVSPAEYVLTANGDVHIENTITIKVPSKGCELTIGPQTVESATYSNSGSQLVETSNLSGISYTSSGGSCGSSGEGGAYAGQALVERVGGGSVSFDS